MNRKRTEVPMAGRPKIPDADIRKAMRASKGNAAEAARRLKCAKSTIQARLRQISREAASSRGGARDHTDQKVLHPTDCTEVALPLALVEHLRAEYRSGHWDPRGLIEACAAVVTELHAKRIQAEKRARMLKSTRDRAWTPERIQAESDRLEKLGTVDEEFEHIWPE